MPGALRRLLGRRPLATLAAGLAALMLAAGCSSEAVSEPEPSAVPEPATDSHAPPAQRTAPGARPASGANAYASLWRAVAAASLDADTARGDPARLPAPLPANGPAGPDAPAPTDPAALGDPPAALGDARSHGAGNAPDGPAAADADSSDEAPSDRAAPGVQWRMEDYAQLSRYLEGIASWYGPNFHGKPTANGETYNQYGLTAAHPVLPIGTRVLVENLSNGRRVWLRINDRGPYAKGRVLDLSRLAAERLGIIAQGTAPVRITVLQWPQSVEPVLGLKAFQQYTVQTAAYPELSSAEELRERLQARHPRFPFFVDRASNGFYAVAAGPFDDEREARQVSHSLHRSGLKPIVKRYRN
jgi:rare lipoprotein A